MTKTDYSLGIEVHKHLVSQGLETPGITETTDLPETSIARIANHFRGIMIELGLDLKDASLIDTPMRIGKMFTKEIFKGLAYKNFPKCTSIPAEGVFKSEEMLIESDIQVHSTCEHHFVVIDGQASIAYIPNKKVIGLSKLNRVVDFFCRRPQVQERLTHQILEALKIILETEHVAVYIRAVHYCVKSRGIMDQSSNTRTLGMSGVFHTDKDIRKEFLGAIHGT